jgi:hypothetical protein
VVEIMGVLLVTGGIVGELWVGVKITSINGSLRTKSGELRSKSDQLLALVTQQSGEARNSADAANKSAGRAQYKANAVSNQTDKLTQELTKDEQGISELEAKRAELEKSLVNLAVCNAPRVIPFWSVKTKTSVDPLKLFGGRQAIIEFVPDAETRRAALSIYGSLDRAGWKIIRISPLDGIEDGVEIQPYTAPTPTSEPSAEWYPLWRSEIRSDDAADALVDFLHSYDWQAKRGWPVDEKGQVIRDPKILPPDTLRIRVGLYPAVIYVSPPGAKDFADFIAKGDQQREAFKKQMDKELADRNEDRMAGPCQPLNFAHSVVAIILCL